MNRRRLACFPALILALEIGLGVVGTSAADWPQLQGNAERTGHTPDAVAPPYRARWIWCGPSLTLRNKESQSGWPDDLRAREGYSCPLPRTVEFTIANSVQPIV